MERKTESDSRLRPLYMLAAESKSEKRMLGRAADMDERAAALFLIGIQVEEIDGWSVAIEAAGEDSPWNLLLGQATAPESSLSQQLTSNGI